MYKVNSSINLLFPILLLLLTTSSDESFLYGICHKALSDSGFQCSFQGLLGLTLAKIEGIEINIMGLTMALNWQVPFLHLPGID